VVSLAKTPFGFFAIAMQNQIVEMTELPRDPKKVAEILIGDEFKKWKESLKKKGLDIDSEDFDPMRAVELIGIKKKEYLDFARLVQIEMSKVDIKKFIGRDYLILQAVSGLDDLNKSINIVVNRIREWYGLHYPELKIEDHEKYLKKILDEKTRGESMGVEFSGKDLEAIKKQSEMVLQMYKVAPNVKNIAGANLGARLIERAGSLGGLAKLPASTIQVLGAEKALFKHLQKGTPSPKHGVIFQHPVINRAPLNKRGKLARTLGTKIALSSRADFYAGELRPSIMADWDKRVKEVLK
jgi:nucleolar protein 56